MKKILFVSATEVKEKSIIGENTNEKIISGALLEVQEIELIPLIGKELYTTLSNEITSGATISGYTIREEHKTILNDYIKPFLIYGTLVYSVIPLHYKLNNKGLNKSTDNNLGIADTKELDSFKNYYKDKFESYKRRLIDFFACDDNDDTVTPINADTSSSMTGIYLPDVEDYSEQYAKSKAYKTNYFRRY